MKLKYIIPVLAVVATVSCQKGEDAPNFNDDPSAVRLMATVGGMFTRSNPTDNTKSTAFNIGDRINVTAGAQLAVSYTFDGTKWSPEAGKYLRWDTETMAFTAWYPSTASMTDFTLPTDQSTAENIASADYMTYSGSQTHNGTTALDFALNRKTARVIVTIADFGDQYPVDQQSVSGVKISSGAASYSGSTVSGAVIETTPFATGSGALNSTYTALVIPSSAQASVAFISLVDGQGTTLYVKNIPALEAGKSYAYNVTVGKDNVTITSITVTDWTTSEVIPGGEAIYKCDDWDGTYAKKLTAGTGTKDDPYLIETAEQLALLSTSIYNQSNPTAYSKCCFKLTTDIDLKYKEWIPIGSCLLNGKVSTQSTFVGSFDGDGHTISGLKVTAVTTDEESIAYVGLFGTVGPNYTDQTIPSIQNLIVRDAKIDAGVTGDDNESQGAGILAGQLSLWQLAGGGSHKAKIKNCRVSGTIHQMDGTTTKYVGGLVGHIQGAEVTNCNANVTIDTQNECVGGLLGYALGTNVENSYCKGSIKGTWSIGGFVGGAEKSTSGNMTITNCTTSVEVTASNWNVGGFIGYFSEGTIANCSASGNVTSTANWDNHTYRTGGFVGTNEGTIDGGIYSGRLNYADVTEDAWKYYGGFTGNHKGGTTVGCHFDGSKNSSLDKSGLSWINENIGIGSNDISNTLE